MPNVQSVGDFTVNIIPTLDQSSMSKTLSTLGNLGMTSQLLKNLKQAGTWAFDTVTLTAEATAEMSRFAKSIGQPIEKVDLLRRAFILSGSSAETANQSMQSLVKTVANIKYGEFDPAMLYKAKINPNAFTGDPLKDVDMLRKHFSRMSAAQRQISIGALGLSDDSLRLLQKTDSEWKNILKSAQSVNMVTQKQGDESDQYIIALKEMTIQYEAFKRSLVTETLPAFKQTVEELKSLFTNKDFIEALTTLSMAIANIASVFATVAPVVSKGANSTVDFIGKRLGEALGFITAPTVVEAKSKIKERTMTGTALEASKNVTVNINASGMGAHEAAQHIAKTVKETIKDEHKNTILNTQKTNRVN